MYPLLWDPGLQKPVYIADVTSAPIMTDNHPAEEVRKTRSVKTHFVQYKSEDYARKLVSRRKTHTTLINSA